MRESTIKVILILIWTVSTLSCLGQDSVRVDPIWKARELREMAMKGRNLEKVVNSQDSTINLLETSIISTHQYYWDQMTDLQKSLENQTKATAHMESLYLSEREQKEYYIKRERKQRRKKNVSTVLVIILAGALIVK